MTHTAILLLGSNVPDRESRLDAAIDRLADVSVVTSRSQVYVSPDRSGLGEPYANIAVQCDTEMDIDGFREFAAQVETRLGRTPQSKSEGVMPVDIDLVEWDGRVVSPGDYASQQYRYCVERLPEHINERTQGALNNN